MGVARREQLDLVVGREIHVAPGRDVAAAHEDAALFAAARGDDVDVAAGMDGRASGRVRAAVGAALVAAAAGGHGDLKRGSNPTDSFNWLGLEINDQRKKFTASKGLVNTLRPDRLPLSE